MSFVSQVLGGSQATTFIYNACSSAAWTGLGGVAIPASAKTSTSGALTANTLVDMLNESGSAGQIDQLSIYTVDATARTIRIVITVDGTQILDATSASISTSGNGGVWAGVYTNLTTFQLPPIKYTNSIRIQYASSLTETGKFTLGLAYQRST